MQIKLESLTACLETHLRDNVKADVKAVLNSINAAIGQLQESDPIKAQAVLKGQVSLKGQFTLSTRLARKYASQPLSKPLEAYFLDQQLAEVNRVTKIVLKETSLDNWFTRFQPKAETKETALVNA